MNAAARKLAGNMCLAASALAAGAIVRGVLTLDGSSVPASVANTVGALVWVAILVNARAHSFWQRMFGTAKA